jgi:hypothetical protein
VGDTMKLVFLGALLVLLYFIGSGFVDQMSNLTAASAKTAAELHSEYPSWSTRDCERVSQHMIWIRMTAEQARESWGAPDEVNHPVYDGGVLEQWVYAGGPHGTVYLYFADGVLSTWAE